MPSPDARPAPTPGLVVQPIDGEVVAYDPAADRLHRLEPSAAAVWARIDGQRRWDAIADDIATAFGIASDVARRDIADLAGVLRERGLLDGSAEAADVARPPAAAVAAELEFDAERQLPPGRLVTRPFRGLEHSFRIATNEPDVRAYLDTILTDLAAAGGDPARYELLAIGDDRYIVRCDDKPIVATGRLDRAMAVLLWHVNAEVVRRSTPRYPLVHAAAAVHDGITVVMPAAPGAGKTTTVAGLLRTGRFGYLTDEAVAIDPATRLPLAYPKPLSIDRGSQEILADLRPAHDRIDGQWQVPGRSISPNAAAEPGPIRLVVEPAYDPGAATCLEPVSRAEMLVRLADSTFNFPDAPERNLHVLANIVENADCYRLPISDLDEAVELITKLCAGYPRMRASQRHAPHSSGSAPAPC